MPQFDSLNREGLTFNKNPIPVQKKFVHFYNNIRKFLFTGTVPVNKNYRTGTVPVNKSYPTGTVPVNKNYPTGTVSVNKIYPTGKF